MKEKISFAPEKCTACGACAVACMDENDIDIQGGQQPYRRIYRCEREGELLSLSIACLHCPDAPCAKVCPQGCLHYNIDTGLTTLENESCIGCKACFRACPYGAPTFRPTGEPRPRYKMEKCHGCLGRVQAGLIPACVRACPTGALAFGLQEEKTSSSLGLLYRKWSASNPIY
jgi:Fe-S-cluster-containing dehydrogenase component